MSLHTDIFFAEILNFCQNESIFTVAQIVSK